MGDIGKGIGEAFVFLLCVCAISVPLGIWKAVELVSWVASHVTWR